MGQKLGRQADVLAASQSNSETKTPAGNPLPQLIHAELSATQLGSGRLIVVGDVHGCSDELNILLRKCQFQDGSDVLVLNGDVVNKGPNSVQVIDYIRSLDGIVVRGNQDDKALADYVHWRSGKPLEEKSKWLQELGEERAEWLAELPFSLSIPCLNLLVVHAGLIPGIPLKEQSLKTLTELRTLPANAFLHDAPLISDSEASAKQPQAASTQHVEPELSEDAPELPWASFWKGPQHVVFGHDAGRQLQTWPCATGLDTGCCYGGQLTALVIPPLQQDSTTVSSSPQGHAAESGASTDQWSRQEENGDAESSRKQIAGAAVTEGTSDVSPGGVSLSGTNTAAAEVKMQQSASVPSLSDLDACLILVPAKKAYSKKKKSKEAA